MAEEDRLIDAGLLPGIDFCRTARALSAEGLVPSVEHVSECAVCLRRWRITEAELQGWVAMGHEEAEALVADMAAVFPASERDEVYRPFYAHLVSCQACERELAELTFDCVLAAPGAGIWTGSA